MQDNRDVVEFIKQVEKHPCIYNVTMTEYSNGSERKRAWCEIAETMKSTEHEVKERWRRLRIAFMRSLRHSNHNNKQYYLYDYLVFLLPYLKIGDQRETEETVCSLSPVSDDEEPEPTPKNSKVEIESEDERSNLNGHAVYFENRYERPRQKSKRKRSDDLELSPRKMFLLSLLPDVESLSEEEMRAFRRTVIGCIDSIIGSRKK